MRTVLAAAGVAIGVFVYASVWAQQEMLPKPGPGSGITKVIGTVNIGNVPETRATQSGEWRVTVSDVTFLKPNTSYVVTWQDGSVERFVAPREGTGGAWVQTGGSQRRWINLGMARAVEEGR